MRLYFKSEYFYFMEYWMLGLTFNILALTVHLYNGVETRSQVSNMYEKIYIVYFYLRNKKYNF